MFDQHLHTTFSPDASPLATFEAYIKKALEKGLTHLTFTDHVDFDCPVPLFQQIPDYLAYFNRLNAAFKNAPVTAHMGVELGYQSHVLKAMEAFTAAHPFACVLLSLHYVNGLDPYDGSLFKNRSIKEALTLYFEAVEEAITRFPSFDILAHIDYVFRYLPGGLSVVTLTDYEDVLTRIFKRLIDQGKILELNTAPWRKSYAINAPVKVLYDMYYQSGGRRISLGSDAHDVNDLSADFDQAAQMLTDIGFESIHMVTQNEVKTVPLSTFMASS